MLKYVNTDIVFQEVPDETTLAINLSLCPCHCPGCHSQYLWTDTGQPLTVEALDMLIASDGANAITCVSFMGGDNDPSAVDRLALYVHTRYPNLKTAWYTGRTVVSPDVDRQNFDYIKVGPYIRHLGPLKSPSTNQRMFRRRPDGSFEDITARFWKR
ncbi:hypothetical protein PRLR6025_28890 [Prevotella lacticifex]|uniref:anaerobic ribonucleoside-triphosphate reductase activating protein n=1 Tax=Prevotella lacticifex TaxID=2854755 RepID=UPI001CC69E81|nr:anaerobic ribonucleoside-triphosphate reductase activating protein [Prevotella lacticifex]MDY6267167.1 anaerobic ribonucleoside-triphosphate reductase activating protein [Prevotella sp.]GJG65086.1 hypothetical protein PRLR6014_15620 [Prevotella lacticifex]GJG69420.1 hypothetical protein PRLR6025_28890 [Prevotella lacticifex]